MNHRNLGTLASRAWGVVFGASVVGAALLAGCGANAPGDEAAAQTESAVGTCPGTEVLKCYIEPGTHTRTCDCYPGAPPPPPPPTCSISGWGTTPQGHEVQISFNTSLPVAMTVRQGNKALHDGAGTYHSFYVAGLQGDANNYAAFAIDGCGSTLNWGYTLPSCGAEGQTACDGRCEKGLADHQIFGLGSCRVDGKNYDHPPPSYCGDDSTCPLDSYSVCRNGCTPCGGHGQISCYRWPGPTNPNPQQVSPCHPGLTLLRGAITTGYLGSCTADSPYN